MQNVAHTYILQSHLKSCPFQNIDKKHHPNLLFYDGSKLLTITRMYFKLIVVDCSNYLS